MRAPHDWMPAGARYVANILLSEGATDDERALITRLSSDARMRSVWRAIGKVRSAARASGKSRGGSRVDERWTWVNRFSVIPDELNDADLADGLFFHDAYFHAHHRVETHTLHDVEEEEQPARETVEQLRAVAKRMRKTLLPSLPPGEGELDDATMAAFMAAFAEDFRHAAAIKAAADFFGAKQAESERRSRSGNDVTLVERNRADKDLRAYVMLMAVSAHRLLGSWMYETIATVTNVALGEDDVTKDHVRRWVTLFDERRRQTYRDGKR
jgi:hypothetical protein